MRHIRGVDAVLHAIQSLPGARRYAVTFRRADGSEQTAVVHLTPGGVDVAEAGLPTGWTRRSVAFAAIGDAVRAFDAARRHASPTATLHDVEGGWDVSLGNVMQGTDGAPTCTAHGPMPEADGVFVCEECGARAAFA
jgi:hypothetical protein